jgi:hypothetical protein
MLQRIASASESNGLEGGGCENRSESREDGKEGDYLSEHIDGCFRDENVVKSVSLHGQVSSATVFQEMYVREGLTSSHLWFEPVERYSDCM